MERMEGCYDQRISIDHEELCWDVFPRPEGKSVVTSKWIYKIKYVAEGSIEKYKEIFVARGFSQKEGIDYE